MIYYIGVARAAVKQIVHKIVSYKIKIIRTHDTVILARENEHVEPFTLAYECVGHTVGTRRGHILVYISCDEQKTPPEVGCKFHIGGGLAAERRFACNAVSDLVYAMERLGPPLYVDIIIVVTRCGDSDFVEVGIREHSSDSLERSARVSVYAYTVKIDKRIPTGQLLDGVTVIGQRIVAQIAVAIGIEATSAQRRASARRGTYHNKSQFGKALIAVVVNGKLAYHLIVLDRKSVV